MSIKEMKDLRQEFNMVGNTFLSEIDVRQKNVVAFNSIDSPSYRRAVVTNIAFYLARKNHSCILMNLDNDDDTFFNSLKIANENRLGVFDKLSEGKENIKYKTGDEKLQFIPRGNGNVISIEDAINDKRLQLLLQELSESYDFVLLNFPTITDSVTVKMLSHLVTDAVFVVNAKSKRTILRKCVQSMQEKKVKILGTVFIS